MKNVPARLTWTALTASLLLGTAPAAWAATITTFTAGDLVVSTTNGTTLNQASPITLQEFGLGAGGTSAKSVGTLTLPQTTSGTDHPISGEYGSSSEGLLTRSVDGHYLTLAGYGVNATAFNMPAPGVNYGTTALAQTTSLTASQQTGTPVVTVPRVVALIGANGTVDTSTALTGVFNQNNPRSVATVNGSSFYLAGQGASKGDPTQGVFYAQRGATTATVVDNSTDARAVSIINNTLYVSRDYNPPGSGNQNYTNVSSITGSNGGLPTSSAGLTETHIIPPASPPSSGGNNGSINLTAGLANGVNDGRIGSFVYLSPEQYFFAGPDVLYVADSGQPKNGNANKAGLGEGGLQKWVLTNGRWTLDYDLVAGLNLVNNANANASDPTAPGVTGLLGLTGEVVGDTVELFATTYGLNELSQSYLYEVTDDLSATTFGEASAEHFHLLYAAADGQAIRGVSFTPIATAPLPAGLPLFAAALASLGVMGWRRRAAADTVKPGQA